MGQGVAIENFHYFLDYNQFFSITTKVGLSYVFSKFLLKVFQKHVASPTFVMIKKLQSTFEKLRWLDNDHIFLSRPLLWATETCKRGFLFVPFFNFHLMTLIKSNGNDQIYFVRPQMMAFKFFQLPKKAWKEGHEMVIRNKEREKRKKKSGK